MVNTQYDPRIPTLRILVTFEENALTSLPQKIANRCLKPLSIAAGYSCPFPSAKRAPLPKDHQNSTAWLVTRVAMAFFAVIPLLPFTLLGLGLRYFCSDHLQEFRFLRQNNYAPGNFGGDSDEELV